MRIVWKDSTKEKEYKPIRYRGFMAWGTASGWEITVPGDNNIYKDHYSAQNAIDQYFGDFGKQGSEKRKSYGIQIVGKKDSTA
jgi:hypothetical protein